MPRFEARPVNKDLFTRVTGVPDKVFQELTVPESPAITKKRARLDKESSPDNVHFRVPLFPSFLFFFFSRCQHERLADSVQFIAV